MRALSRLTALLAAALLALVGAGYPVGASGPAIGDPASPVGHQATTPIQHFIFAMQGDRSFDNYFGTFPGADGIPAATCQEYVAGHPKKGCVKPFLLNPALPGAPVAGATVINRQWNNGKMDQFVSAFRAQGRDGSTAMGHYDAAQLPFYWNAAREYVLFDSFFSSSRSGPTHNRSYWVAARDQTVTISPTSADPGRPTIFDRLQTAGVSWKFYVQNYRSKETYRSASATDPASQPGRVPLLNIGRFIDDQELNSHIVDLGQYYADLSAGTLPSVAYIATSSATERTARSVVSGQNLMRNMTTQLMLSRYWSSSALLLSYDGPGGWFDHVAPPQVDADGYGLRVPALLLSPYAVKGQVNHTVLDYTSALTFIEKNWQLAPLTARDALAKSIAGGFDFTSPARPPAILHGTNGEPPPAVLRAPAAARAVFSAYGASVVLVVLVLLVAGLMPSAQLRWRMRRMRWRMRRQKHRRIGWRIRRRGAHSAARWRPSRLAPQPDDRLAESLR